MHRLRHAHRTALLLSTSLACISLALIICVAPLLPTPDRSANIRLGLVLALACEVALDSALLLVAGVVWLRRQSRTDFLDGGDSEAHSGSSASSSEGGAGASSTTVGDVADTARRPQGVDVVEQTPSSRAERGSSESKTTTATASSGEVKEAKGAGKFLDVATQTEEEF